MNSICLNFKVHLPHYYKKYHFFDIGSEHNYYDHKKENSIVQKVSQRCYIPANNLMMNLIAKYGDKVSFSFTISGTLIELLENYAPDVLQSFEQLVSTGRVELMSTPYYHSLAAIQSSDEFKQQVKLHQNKMLSTFGVKCNNFINTDMVYADYIGIILSEMGYKGVVTEGAKHILGWRSPNYVYSNPVARNLKILFRNQDLSDDISMRFSNSYWTGYPLTADKFVDWLIRDPNHKCVTIAMDYRVIGDYMDRNSGIFNFFEHIPENVFKYTNFKFRTPDMIFDKTDASAPVYIPNEISWMAAERDLSAWTGNDLQKDLFRKLYTIEESIKRTNDKELLNDWRNMQDSDNLYDMNLRWLNEKQFDNAKYSSPYDAYINYMNMYNDLEIRQQQIKYSRMVLKKRLKERELV